MLTRFVPKSTTLFLRKLKAQTVGLLSRVYLVKNRLADQSKQKVLLLSFGGHEGSHMLAKAARDLGYSVHVLAPKFPSYEGRYASGWSKVDVITDIDYAISIAKKIEPIAALVDIRNVLLPTKYEIQKALRLRDFGDISYKTSNSKIRVREILDTTTLRNVKWSTLDEFDNSGLDYPVIVKPETGSGSKGVTLVQSSDDLQFARIKIESLTNDPTVGGRALVEQYIAGDNYDVTGIIRDGEIYPFTVQLMNFTPINGAMPSSYYLHNPPISKHLRRNLIDSALRYVTALGVKVGAFTCEMRQSDDGGLYLTDFANRIATPATVSKAAGNSLNEFYIRAMCEAVFTKPVIEQNCVYQRFVRDKEELSKFEALIRQHPDMALDVRKLSSNYAGVVNLARIAVWTHDFETMQARLSEFDLQPNEFLSFSN